MPGLRGRGVPKVGDFRGPDSGRAEAPPRTHPDPRCGVMPPNEAYELRQAASKAAVLAKKILPPMIGDIVSAEIGWMKDSTWTTNHARLKHVIAEINELAEE